MQYWDLKVLLPIFFIASILSMVFLCWKEKIQKNSFLWLIQIVLFWIAAGFIGNELKNEVSQLSAKNFIIATVFSTSLFLIILKPLATFTTGIFQNRKIWIQISSCIMVLLLILINTISMQTWTIIILSILFSFCLASSTLFYLFLNEQSYYRIYVLPSVWITFIFILFSTTFGLYLSNLNLIIANNSKTSNLVFLSLLSIGVCIGFGISFLTNENKNMVQVFDTEILEELPRKNNLLFCIIYLLAFLLTITSALNNSLFIKIYLALNLTNLNLQDDTIRLWLRINDFAYLIPSIIVSVFGYKIIRKVFEQKYLIFINLFALFITYTTMAFVQNPYFFIFLNIFAGICFNQIIYSLFTTCVFWNYRAKRNPVTGFYGSAMFSAYFIVEVLQNTLSGLKVNIFKNFSSVEELLQFKDSATAEEMQNFVNIFDNISTLMMSIACVMVLVALLIFYFSGTKIFADYVKYKFATQNLKVLIKKRVISKTKTKMDVEAIEEGIKENYE